MIGFLQPLALLGLAAALVPPLLHLRSRKLPPTVPFPAVRYLTATEREHKQRLRLRNLLLMLLRTAIIALVALAAARPVLRVPAAEGPPAGAIALVVDNSLSSAAVAAGQRQLDGLIRRARRVAERVALTDRFWLALADGVPRRLSPLEARTILDSLTPWPVRLDLGTAVAAAGAAIASEVGTAGGVVVVASDLQATALSPAGEAASSVRVLAFAPPEPPPNRGIDSAWAEPSVWTADGSVVVAVGGASEGAAGLALTVNGRPHARAVVRAGERVVLRAAGLPPGWHTALVELDPDELRADDRWWLPLRVREPARVRVLAGVGRFVEQAVDVLRAGGRVRAADGAGGVVVMLADRPVTGRVIVFPPADAALAGAVNRALAARGVTWRLGTPRAGEWMLAGTVGAAAGAAVTRRYRLDGPGEGVVATAGGEPWLVASGDVVLVASRMEEDWTSLPVTAAFVPFLDFVVNRVAREGAWVVDARPGEVVPAPPGAVRLALPTGAVPLGADRRIAAPLAAGVHFLEAASGDTVGALAVNHDRRESALVPASAAELRAALGPTAAVLDDDALERALFGGARRADLTGILVAVALVAALAELALATAGGRARREAA